MSLDLESRLRVLLASAPQRLYSIPTLEISHSAMSRTYHLWREPRAGQTTTEAGQVVDMQGANFEIKLAGTFTHLDQLFTINLDTVDIEDTFRAEMDRVPLDTEERVRIVYREFVNDDLTEPQAVAVLQLEEISYVRGAATLTASSPRLNMTRTGDLYVPREIPMLRGFL